MQFHLVTLENVDFGTKYTEVITKHPFQFINERRERFVILFWKQITKEEYEKWLTLIDKNYIP